MGRDLSPPTSVRIDDHHSLAERLVVLPRPINLPPLIYHLSYFFSPRRSRIRPNTKVYPLNRRRSRRRRRLRIRASINVCGGGGFVPRFSRSVGNARERGWWPSALLGGETGGEGRAAHRRSISRGCQATNIHHQPTIPVPTPGACRRNRRLRRAPLRWRHLPRRRPIRATPAVPAAADSRAMHSTLAGSRLGAAAGPPPFRAADAPLASYRKSHASPPPPPPTPPPLHPPAPVFPRAEDASTDTSVRYPPPSCR